MKLLEFAPFIFAALIGLSLIALVAGIAAADTSNFSVGVNSGAVPLAKK